MKTPKLGLNVTSPAEWQTLKYEDYILLMAGQGETSNMSMIDAAVGNLQDYLSKLETALSAI